MDRVISLAGRLSIAAGRRSVDERALPGRQPRLVFALMVLERRGPVARDVLVANLWPQQPPDTWESALRGIVSRVRRFLAAGGLDERDLLRAEAGGYRLRLPAATTVDVEVAAEQAVSARDALAADDAELTADLAGRARGVLVLPFLAGVEAPWIDAKRAELSRLLGQVLEILAEARLTLGGHGLAATAAEDALALDPFRESAHRLLIRALVAGGNHARGLQAYERCRRLLAEELGTDPAPDTQALHQEILRAAPPAAAPEPLSQLGPTPAAAPDRCPYLGLQTFDETDADRFFGRGADVSRLLDRLRNAPFLAVLGPSGSGKSSLVRAGLVPALRHGAVPGSDAWAVRVLRPGAVPVKALVRELADLDPGLDRAAAVERSLRDERALHETVRAALDAGVGAGRVVLVVDQLEEVFTLCAEEEPRQAFLDALAAASEDPSGRMTVIVTLRADFYHRLARYPRLADLASAHQFLVTPMDEVGLAAAVQGPARAAGLALEAGLTETILRDVARRPGSLPLLGHALLELWERRSEGTLTLAAYREVGGVGGALAQRAEVLYAGLSRDEQAVAGRVLLRLIHPGEGTQDTRRRVAYAELPTRAEEQEDVERVVGALTSARLLTAGGAPDAECWVEVSHEALLRGWPRLRRWMEEDRAGLLVHRRLTEDASEWARLDRDPGALYRGAHLAEAAAWAERNPDTANARERAFLEASLHAQDAERRRRLRRLRLTAASLAVGFLAVAALSLVALVQASRAAEEARVATARGLAAAAVANLDVDPERSILLALEAADTTHAADGTVLAEAEEALHQAVKRSRVVLTVPQGGHGLAVSPDGSRFATGASDPTGHSATVWDTETGAELLALPGAEGPLGVAFSPDGRLLATNHTDGTVQVYDASTGEVLGVLAGHDGPLGAPVFGPDGRRLATAGADQTVRIWDVVEGVEEITLTGHSQEIWAVAFSPDGDRVASAGHDTTGRIWDVATGETAVTRVGHQGPVVDVAFSPDGARVTTVSHDGTARTWDAASGDEVLTVSIGGFLRTVAYSPDGDRVAAGGGDGKAGVWDADTGDALLTLAGHGNDVVSVSFTPDGDGLLTGGVDGATRL